jgi:Fe-S-cluster containining protein
MAKMTTISHREKICLACSQKTCCSYYVVHLTGRDVRRIAQALQLFPADFVRYYEPQKGGEELFRLSPEGPRYALMLAKRELPEALGAPCVFLVRTNDGQARCGLHDLRPLQCQVYPVFVEGDTVMLINDVPGCARAWSYGDIDLDAEQARCDRLKAFEAEHMEMVREWNRRILEEGVTRCFEDFCTYLLNHCGAQEDAA